MTIIELCPLYPALITVVTWGSEVQVGYLPISQEVQAGRLQFFTLNHLTRAVHNAVLMVITANQHTGPLLEHGGQAVGFGMAGALTRVQEDGTHFGEGLGFGEGTVGQNQFFFPFIDISQTVAAGVAGSG